MKKLILALVLLSGITLLQGCDDDTVTIPPQFVGTGSVYIFSATEFHESLNAWLSLNKSAKLVSLNGINKNSDGRYTSYLVVVEYPPSAVPQQPLPPDPNSVKLEH